MAENENGEEKTEMPTAKKLRDARKKGQVMKSQDVVSVVFLLITFAVLRISAKLTYKVIAESTEYWLLLCGAGIGTDNTVDGDLVYRTMIIRMMKTIAVSCLPVMLVSMVATIVATGAQTRFLISAESIKFKLSKLNPIEGIKKMFSGKALFELAKSLLKFIVIAAVVYAYIKDKMGEVARTMDMEPAQGVAFIAQSVYDIVMRIGVIFIAIAAIDFFYQRYSFTNDMKMTKQEVKDEYKETEGNPTIKGKRKQKQYELHNLMMQDVKGADVVVRNPTHFAVALKYDPDVRDAPFVVAKGADRVAARIIAEAERNKVTVVENIPLARALYEKAELNDEIPYDFYHDVAEVLNFVYELENRKPPRAKKRSTGQ